MDSLRGAVLAATFPTSLTNKGCNKFANSAILISVSKRNLIDLSRSQG